MPYNFDELCLPCYDELVAFATKRTRNEQKARDLVQDAYVRAVRAWDRWEPDGDPAVYARAWMYRIVNGVFINDYQREKQYARLTGNVVGGYRPGAKYQDGSNKSVVFGGQTLGRTAESVQVAGELHQDLECNHPYLQPDSIGDEVREALDRIRPEWAEVVRRIYIEGKGETVVMAELGLARGTVRSRMARGRMALARILGPVVKQRFGYQAKPARVSGVAGGADEVDDSLEATEELQADADRVEAVVRERDRGSLGLRETRPYALTTNAG